MVTVAALCAAGVADLAVAEAGRRAVRVQLAGAAAAAEAAARARGGGAPGRGRAAAGALRRAARPGAPRGHRRLQRLHLGRGRERPTLVAPPCLSSDGLAAHSASRVADDASDYFAYISISLFLHEPLREM